MVHPIQRSVLLGAGCDFAAICLGTRVRLVRIAILSSALQFNKGIALYSSPIRVVYTTHLVETAGLQSV